MLGLCRSSDWRSSLSSRVFSIAITAERRKLFHEFDLLVGQWPYFLAIDDNRAIINETSLSIRTASRVAAPPSAAEVKYPWISNMSMFELRF